MIMLAMLWTQISGTCLDEKPQLVPQSGEDQARVGLDLVLQHVCDWKPVQQVQDML